jgi:putative hydrolase of the HAD superfamily
MQMPNSSPVASPTAPESPALPIDAVLFDYGMVLSGPPDPVAWERMRSITGLDEDRLHAAYWTFRHDYDRGALTGPDYWRAVAAHAGIALDREQMPALLAADIDLWTTLNPPMVALAGRLQRAGVRTGILSNIGDCIAEGVVARLPWLAGFYCCIWSHALFTAKPEPAIYLKAAEALGSAPAHILFIDDREENVAAAVAVGMIAIRYTGQADFEREMRVRGFASLLDAGRTPARPESPSIDCAPEPAAK